MFYSPKKMSPDILKVYSLSSTLSLQDQVQFLDLLISTKDREGRRELIDKALIGERVWEQKQAV